MRKSTFLYIYFSTLLFFTNGYSQEFVEKCHLDHVENVFSPQILNLESAYSLVLTRNRQLINNEDATLKSQYQIEMATSEFDVQIKPTGDVGYVGGGTGSGAAYGTGI